MQQTTAKKVKVYAVAIAIPLAVGGLSAFLTADNMNLYSEIITPPLAPPSILFPIVWTLLYVLMGISSGMIWQRREDDMINTDIDKGISFYALSLAFNFCWSIIFFNFREFLIAFIWLLLLLYLTVRTVISYKKVYPVAAYLQIPYVVWLAFAGYLNLAIWILNR